MEYYLLILNRSFEITISSDLICGARIRGAIAIPGPRVPLNLSAGTIAAARSGDAEDLFRPEALSNARIQEPGSTGYLAQHRWNFAIPKSSVTAIRFTQRKKWGMGMVPHCGRLFVDLRDRTTRELILLGDYEASPVLNTIKALGYPMTAV